VNREESTHVSRAQFQKWVANGEIPIVIGTHALIQNSLSFKTLAYAIIDEQHRFGKIHRQKLTKKDGLSPHLLSMTATPIPRTLALTIYGDLDLSLLDEMPAGRKPVITEVLGPEKREQGYARVREELAKGRQAYVICPRIDEPDPTKELALQAKSVTAEAKRLKKEVFPEAEIGILHSKMTAKEKEEVMQRFERNDINILCATSVVEVGVNVPNATVILIEGAERFGLAQLHQLRGRVIRSTHQAYCFALPETYGENTKNRLKALTTAKNGFELSEYDLALRGAGELTGARQWGVSDLAMEAIKNLKLVEAARNEAQTLITNDPALVAHPLLAAAVKHVDERMHME
jgi:ATP-dependent DNA helicase RecG